MTHHAGRVYGGFLKKMPVFNNREGVWGRAMPPPQKKNTKTENNLTANHNYFKAKEHSRLPNHYVCCDATVNKRNVMSSFSY